MQNLQGTLLMIFMYSENVSSTYRNDLPPESSPNYKTLSYIMNLEIECCDEYKITPLINQKIIFARAHIFIS